jgi:large conductance mechanosensitive channel
VITLAVIYFVFVVPMNSFRERLDRGKAPVAEATPADIELLTEIRDLLKDRQQP